MNKRTIYSIGYNRYEFVFYIRDETIRIFLGGWSEKEDILKELPEGFSWENIESIFQNGDHKKEISDLAIKIYEMYEKIKNYK